MAVRYGLILLLLYAFIPRVSAGDLAELQVTESGSIYRIRMVMVVYAPARYVRGVLFFCKSVGRVEDVRELASGDLQAEIVPELSNLKSGTAEWRIQRAGEHTLVAYQADMEPDFFIPPLIGSYFVRSNIRKEIMTSFTRLECVAQMQARLDSVSHLQLAGLGIDTVCRDQCNNDSTHCKQ